MTAPRDITMVKLLDPQHNEQLDASLLFQQTLYYFFIIYYVHQPASIEGVFPRASRGENLNVVQTARNFFLLLYVLEDVVEPVKDGDNFEQIAFDEKASEENEGSRRIMII
jgi:hypothetical protein